MAVAALAATGAAEAPAHCRVGAYDVDTVPHPIGGGPGWRATVRHRRTGAVSTMDGTIRGAPPALVAVLAPVGAPLGAEREVPLHDFPEALARQLLAPHALDDEALLAPVIG
jgi:hypothetical protein